MMGLDVQNMYDRKPFLLLRDEGHLKFIRNYRYMTLYVLGALVQET